MTDLSRRKFAALAAGAIVGPFAWIEELGANAGQKAGTTAEGRVDLQAGVTAERADSQAGTTTERSADLQVGLSAQELIDRIKKNIGVAWKPESVDAIKAGDPSIIATGVVTTSMATLHVLREAVKARANVIITAQPTFYGRADTPTPPPARGGGSAGPDRVFAAKDEFIATNKLVVVRLSEHWRMRQPDPLAQGLAMALGWGRYQSAADPVHLSIPPITLERLAANVNTALKSRGGIRAIGNRTLRVRRIGLLPGTTPILSALKVLPNVDVIIAGEVREWESVEYVRDQVFSGAMKGLILVGRVVSEEPGMELCANWLKTFIPEVPIRHISAGDPYWRPV
jgi:putative NIF3 family GTP cyclohydrolase 1 type 2